MSNVPLFLRRRAVTSVLMAMIAGLALSGCTFNGAYDLPLPGKIVSDSDGYRVTAEFKDVVSVVPRTVVMANDVPVGQVDSVTRDGWNAKVVMTIKNSIVLPKDATAAVQQTSLLGEKYIALTPPQGSTVAAKGRLSNGDFIPLDVTSRDPEVEDVLGALSALLSGGGVAQLHTISTELNKAMDGRQADIRSALRRLDTFVGTLDQQKKDIVSALESVNTLAATLNKERSTIGAALDSFGPALKVLNQQHAGLVKMLSSLDHLGVVGTSVINQSRANIVASLKHLGPALKGLADAGDSLVPGLMLMASFPFPPAAATLAKGDYSNALFAMNFDLNQLVTGLASGGHTLVPNLATLCSAYAGSGTCAPLMSALCQTTGVSIFCTSNGLPSSLTAAGKTTRTRTKSNTPPPSLLGGLLGLSGGRQSGSGGSGGSSSGSRNPLQSLLGGLL